MTPTVLRQSGPKFMKDGVMFTPRAAIHMCEICMVEGAPHGFTDEHGKRLYYCSEHKPDRKAKGEAR